MVNFIRKATKKSLLALLKRGDKMTRSDWERLFEGVLFKDEYETFSAAGGIDHGALGGLTDNDHTQYTLHSLADAASDFLVASGADAFVKKTLAETGAILETDLDHGNIQGLADDDHTRYVDKDGTRALTGDWDVGAYDIRAADLTADDGGVYTDTITELTGATGVTIEGVEIKDSNIAAVDYAFVTANDGATNVTAAELEELTDESTTTLHNHAVNASLVCLSTYTDVKARNSAYHLHGHFHSLDTAHDLSGGDLVVTVGISKVVIVVNAGGDLVGDITVTGTTVDRNTGTETAAQTDTLTIDAATTDGSDTDASANARYSFTGAYITSRWFKGSITISSANTAVTDMDTYQVAFEQCNDSEDSVVNSFDISAHATNTNAWMYAYLYLLKVAGDKCNISRVASLELPAADVAANTHYRLRRGLLGEAFDGTSDGFWVDLFPGPLASAYWEDINTKVWVGANAGETTETGYESIVWNAEDLVIGDTTPANCTTYWGTNGAVRAEDHEDLPTMTGDFDQCWFSNAGDPSLGGGQVKCDFGVGNGYSPSDGKTLRVEAVYYGGGAGAFATVYLQDDATTEANRIYGRVTLANEFEIWTVGSGSDTMAVQVATGLTTVPLANCWFVLMFEYNFATKGYRIRVKELGAIANDQEDSGWVSGNLGAVNYNDVEFHTFMAYGAGTTASTDWGLAQLTYSDDTSAFPEGTKLTSNFVP